MMLIFLISQYFCYSLQQFSFSEMPKRCSSDKVELGQQPTIIKQLSDPHMQYSLFAAGLTNGTVNIINPTKTLFNHNLTTQLTLVHQLNLGLEDIRINDIFYQNFHMFIGCSNGIIYVFKKNKDLLDDLNLNIQDYDKYYNDLFIKTEFSPMREQKNNGPIIGMDGLLAPQLDSNNMNVWKQWFLSIQSILSSTPDKNKNTISIYEIGIGEYAETNLIQAYQFPGDTQGLSFFRAFENLLNLFVVVGFDGGDVEFYDLQNLEEQGPPKFTAPIVHLPKCHQAKVVNIIQLRNNIVMTVDETGKANVHKITHDEIQGEHRFYTSIEQENFALVTLRELDPQFTQISLQLVRFDTNTIPNTLIVASNSGISVYKVTFDPEQIIQGPVMTPISEYRASLLNMVLLTETQGLSPNMDFTHESRLATIAAQDSKITFWDIFHGYDFDKDHEKCYTDCRFGSFYNSNTNQCLHCSENCLTCTESHLIHGTSICELCQDKFFLVPGSFFPYANHGPVCVQACPNDADNWKPVQEPNAMYYDREERKYTMNNTCQQTKESQACGPYQYFNAKKAQCVECHPNCYHCSGSTENQCLSCFNFLEDQSSNEIACCPDGFFRKFYPLSFQNPLLNPNQIQCQSCAAAILNCISCNAIEIAYQGEKRNVTKCYLCRPGYKIVQGHLQSENTCELLSVYSDNSEGQFPLGIFSYIGIIVIIIFFACVIAYFINKKRANKYKQQIKFENIRELQFQPKYDKF